MLIGTLLAYGGYSTFQTLLPLYAAHLGASATLLGVLVAAFSVPSVILRPALGSLVDGWSRRAVHLIGGASLGVVGFLYLLPSLGTLLAVRMLHGAGWAAFNTAGGTGVAVLAPTSRRGEASGIYNLMPGLANMVVPAASLLLLSASGFGPPFVVAGLLGLSATAVLAAVPLPTDPPRPSGPRTGLGRPWSGLERHALLPMAIEFLFNTTQTLFWIYPPLFAATLGIPVEGMAAYYIPVGIGVVLSRLIAGRLIDRAGRGQVLWLGALAVGAALVVAGTATSIVPLAVGGILHAVAASLITPTAMAVAIDGSTSGRRGASIATYSLGYQLGVGAGGLLWGAAIDVFGYPPTYFLALLGPIAIGLTILRSPRLRSRVS